MSVSQQHTNGGGSSQMSPSLVAGLNRAFVIGSWMVVVGTLVICGLVYWSVWRNVLVPWGLTGSDLWTIENESDYNTFSKLFYVTIKCVLLVGAHVLAFGGLGVSYCKTVVGDPGYVPLPKDSTVQQRKAHRIATRGVDPDELEADQRARSSDGNRPYVPRKNQLYCYQCEIERPDRAHHCRICGRCVKRFDHHCPFVNNCIGSGNMKAFLLLMIYATLTFFMTITFLVIRMIQILYAEKFDWRTDYFDLIICGLTIWVSFALAAGAIAMGVVNLNIVSNNQTKMDQLLRREKKDDGISPDDLVDVHSMMPGPADQDPISIDSSSNSSSSSALQSSASPRPSQRHQHDHHDDHSHGHGHGHGHSHSHGMHGHSFRHLHLRHDLKCCCCEGWKNCTKLLPSKISNTKEMLGTDTRYWLLPCFNPDLSETILEYV